jgi:YrbI family 3-deoxy-D-manno-octulosonate 8-phosphate phosphatase
MLNSYQLTSVRFVAFDFDGVFTNNTVQVSQDGIESVQCWRSDGLGVKRLRSIGVQTMIISTETNLVVGARAAKLKIPSKQGIEDKAIVILEACRELKIPPQHTMFVGNDINDIAAFQVVGIPVAVADAYIEVLPFVCHQTSKPGGYGAVRELCDLIYEAQAGNTAAKIT